ncbi:MAG: MltA domain-containing protein [Planctomycetota bacterium]
MSLCRGIGLSLIALSLAFVSCATQRKKEEKPDYSRALAPGQSALELVTDLADYPDFREMYQDRKGALAAIEESLKFFSKPSSQQWYPFEDFTHARVVASLTGLKELLTRTQSPQEFSGFAIKDFDVYRSVGWDGSGDVLFTGYCQPIFQGSRTAQGPYQHPIYALPDDLVKDADGRPRGQRVGEQIVSYPSRAEIENGGLLKGKRLELVYLKSPLEVFIVHVQGSAKIELPRGGELYLGYAGKTDREYTSLGKELVKDQKIDEEELSLTAIRRYFDAHPGEIEGYLHRNESFVFFAEYPPGGPFGSLGAAVTPFHSIATDKAIFPRGAPCAVSTTAPRMDRAGKMSFEPFVSLVCDQDTGGAIRSAGRCDIFMGTGPKAETLAGYTKHEGRLFYLFLKDRAEP